jgi:hypothetical protein
MWTLITNYLAGCMVLAIMLFCFAWITSQSEGTLLGKIFNMLMNITLFLFIILSFYTFISFAIILLQ